LLPLLTLHPTFKEVSYGTILPTRASRWIKGLEEARRRRNRGIIGKKLYAKRDQNLL
jgi:hypothetical protein